MSFVFGKFNSTLRSLSRYELRRPRTGQQTSAIILALRAIRGQVLRWTLFAWILAGPASMAATQTSPGGEEAPIVIRADRAWEGDEGEVLYLAGSFEMSSADWRVTAENAEVHGPVQDPERVVVTGSPDGAPARISIKNEDATIAGRGGRIVYRYREEVIELYDDALLEGEDVSMASSVIVYDLKNERLRSSGSDGVEVIVRRNGDDG